MPNKFESGASGGNNSNADAWASLSNESQAKKGKYVQGPDGRMIPEEEYDAAMAAYEREEYYKTHPGAREADALDARLGEMDANPDRLDNFEGEHRRGASTRDSEYTTLNTGDNGMYAAAPDGTPLNNAKRKEMARMMHDAEDLQTFEEDERYKDYITRERAKIGTVYESRDDFNHRVVARLKRLEQRPKPEGGEQPPEDDTGKVPELPGPVIGETPRLPGPVIGETPQLPGPTKIEIGDINIRGVEQTFNEIKKEDLEKAEKSLSELQPQIAELYARNRRLIVGGKNRAEFERVKGEYGKIMDQYLRLKTGETFENEKRALGGRLEQKLDELKADIEAKLTEFSKSEIGGPYRTQEEVDAEKAKLIKEAETAVKEWYDKEYAGIKTKVNTEFLEGLIKQETDLEKATTNALDNGSFCRKFVSKVLNNKVLKGALVTAGMVGLAATGVGIATGLAAGTLAVGFNLTGAGFALGAAKGGLGAALMSRQDSKISKVRGFASREDIAKQIGEMDVTGENADVQGVSNWLMKQYEQANRQDRSSNLKRTAVSTGIGALLGGLASGLHFDKTVNRTTTTTEIIDHNPIEYKPQLGAENVNVSPNHGYLQIFEQVGGDPNNAAQWDEAFKITQQIAQKYGVVSDMSKGVISPTGVPELLPGSPSTWDTTSQQFLNDILNTWASKGCIPGIRTGGDAIWGPVERTVPHIIKNSIVGYLARGTAYATGAAVGGAIGGARAANRAPQSPETNVDSVNDTVAETQSPEANVASVDDAAVESYVGPLSNLLGEDYPEDVRHRVIVTELAQRLYPESSNNGGNDPEAVLANLSDEQRNHLEALYERIAREAAERRARDEANAAPGADAAATSPENQ